MVAPGSLEAIGGLLLFVLIGLGKSLINGKLRVALESRRERKRTNREQTEFAKEAHAQIPVLVEKVDEVQTTVEETREHAEAAHEKADEIGRAVVLLHDDDLPEEKVENLRDRLGVEDLDRDIAD